MLAATQGWRGQGLDDPLEPQKEGGPADHNFGSVILMRIFGLQNYERINLNCFNLPSLYFITVATRN